MSRVDKFISKKEINNIVDIVYNELGLQKDKKYFSVSVRNLSVIIFLDKFVLKLQKRNTHKFFNETLDDADLFKRGEMEWNALSEFYKLRNEKNFKIRAIKPVKYIKKHNILVTEKYKGIDFFEYLEENKIDLTKKNKKIEKYFKNVGALLADMHQKNGLKIVTDSNIIEQIQKDLNMENTLLRQKDKDSITAKLDELKKIVNYNNIYSLNINGFQVRNILTDKNFEDLILLDISKIEEGSIYRMLGMFTATAKIIHQGKWYFPFKKIDDCYNEIFLQEYSKNIEGFDKRMFDLYYFQQLLILYKYVAKKIMYKRIPFKLTIKKYYLDKIYLKEFYKILNNIKLYG
jgi:hypothetical protein